MIEYAKIHDFAVKWFERFRNPNTYYPEIAEHMGNECAALDFTEDGGSASFVRYNDASHDYIALRKIIGQVTDIPLLGSAIYSQWKYYSDWAAGGENFLSFECQAWFLTALERLKVLVTLNPDIFRGTPKSISIVSNNLCYDPEPKPNDEIEQHLTINSGGGVWFSSYCYGDGKNYLLSRSKSFHISKAASEAILNAVGKYFTGEYALDYVDDTGWWEMNITNTDGDVFYIESSLDNRFEVDGTDLSDLIRSTLDMNDLFVFDGRANWDLIDRVVLDFTSKLMDINVVTISGCEYRNYCNSEKLIIDRQSGTLEYSRKSGPDFEASQRLFDPYSIGELLDSIKENDLFGDPPREPEDTIDISDKPNEYREYTLTADFRSGKQQSSKGIYNTYGLPAAWGNFIEAVNNLMYEYHSIEMFNPSVYKSAKRRPSEIMYCLVRFGGSFNSYYYISDDDSIKVGDMVIVPAGKTNREAVVMVMDVKYFHPDNAPLPPEKTKHIIRKCTDENTE